MNLKEILFKVGHSELTILSCIGSMNIYLSRTCSNGIRLHCLFDIYHNLIVLRCTIYAFKSKISSMVTIINWLIIGWSRGGVAGFRNLPFSTTNALEWDVLLESIFYPRFEPSFLTLNVFEWEHMVGTPLLSYAGTPFENCWIHTCMLIVLMSSFITH